MEDGKSNYKTLSHYQVCKREEKKLLAATNKPGDATETTERVITMRSASASKRSVHEEKIKTRSETVHSESLPELSEELSSDE